ncbi:MAG: hypothetical protein A2622_07810 [Bdellovibrionales bacterium RIFCSPHIGHO2_01_FULL_40_29]|nr:MAG: hypothetical protein A2622_07810 [Bdellovibrionales bacterium RIFCSPHIGHO2_01_FULL_40_29]OFZ33711.1 MAG: hypothetical protein A3D17_09900 [Bdellovibrionales bacterium RIFCSPHIGHO2_02_FULL_40_15]
MTLKRSLSLILLVTLSLTSTAFADQIFETQYNAYVDDFYSKVIPEYHIVNDGIIRGGRPQKGDLAMLKKQGVKTIINIDDSDSALKTELAEAKKLGIDYISSPLSSFSTPKDDQVNMILEALQDPTKQPVFLHCKHGQDRTGMIMGLYRYRVDKWTAREAYAEMKELGFHSILRSLDKYFKKQTNYK